jgi:Icc-related predicted phosphoesterase
VGLCFFATDLHGRQARYEKLFAAIDAERPDAVFLGGDLLPFLGFASNQGEEQYADFVRDYLAPRFRRRPEGTRVFLILGNDDAAAEETAIREAELEGAWEYVHGRAVPFGGCVVYGYQYVPPTPFRLKDWERYDVSRYVDPGCVPPEHGARTVQVPEEEIRFATIAEDLEALAGEADLGKAIFLFHTPPYRTKLDRAALDGKAVDHAPLDVHVGSIAVRRFLEARQPLLSLHGHVHESVRLTGQWRQQIARTWIFGGAHEGPELALVRFDPDDLASATRQLL